MKTKLLFLLTFIVSSINIHSQTEVMEYAEGLIDPIRMISSGTDLFVLGNENLYLINTSTPTPTITNIFSPEENFFIYNLVKSGDILYMAQENFNETTGEFFGSSIVSLDLNNLSAPVEVIYSAGEFINALTIDGDIIYFSSETLLNPPNFDPFVTHIDKIDITETNPTATTIVANLTDGVAQDIVLYNNDLYVSDIDNGIIHKFDATQIEPTVDNYLINLSTPRGLTVFGNELYISANYLLKKIDLDDLSADTVDVAQNTTINDVNNGMDFWANIRDVAIIEDTIYMILQEENNGRIVTVTDATLSQEDVTLNNNISVFNSSDNITVNGLESDTQVELYNLSGQLVTTKNLTPSDNNINISAYAKGVYLLKADNAKVFKLIK